MKKAALTLLIVLMAISAFAGGSSLLENGVKFIEIKRDFTETVSVIFFVRGGTVRETKENNGIGSLFAASWVKSSELLKKVEFYGAGIGASVGSDFQETSFSVTSENFDNLLEYYKDFLLNPVIDEQVFEQEKFLTKEGIKASMDSPDARAYKEFITATYKNHPYGMSSSGEIESIDKITLEDVRAYAGVLLQGSNITVAVAGKYTDEQLQALKDIFAQLPKGEQFKFDCAGSSVESDETITVTDEKLQQAKLYIGYEAPDASSEDYPKIKLMADILGGGMSSRYFNVLRKDKGYAYSVGAYYPSRICGSRFVAHIGLAEQNVQDAIETIDRLNREFVNDLTEAELDAVRNYLLGRTLIESQTNSKQAWYACFFENTGLGSDYFANYIDILKKITVEDVKDASKIFSGFKTIYILK